MSICSRSGRRSRGGGAGPRSGGGRSVGSSPSGSGNSGGVLMWILCTTGEKNPSLCADRCLHAAHEDRSAQRTLHKLFLRPFHLRLPFLAFAAIACLVAIRPARMTGGSPSVKLVINGRVGASWRSPPAPRRVSACGNGFAAGPRSPSCSWRAGCRGTYSPERATAGAVVAAAGRAERLPGRREGRGDGRRDRPGDRPRRGHEPSGSTTPACGRSTSRGRPSASPARPGRPSGTTTSGRSGTYGVSNPRTFVVGDRPESQRGRAEQHARAGERRSRSTRSSTARSRATDVDCFAFEGEEGPAAPARPRGRADRQPARRDAPPARRRRAARSPRAATPSAPTRSST